MSEASPSFDLEAPDSFTAGAVGPPGKRVFYLQAREAGALVTLEVEKEHVSALVHYLGGLLANLPAAPGPGPAAPGGAALREPVEAAWAVASLGVAYDEEAERVVLLAEERVEEEADREVASARFRLSRGQAALFVDQARALLRAGRPDCPICGRPMDPGGHVCPRSNGHVVT